MDRNRRSDLPYLDSVPPPSSFGAPSLGQRIGRFLTDLLETLLIAGVLFLGVNLATARVRVESLSMQPNLFEGEFVVVNKLAYRWTEPERGDIVVFRFPLNPEKRYIKRLIGLEGDFVEARDGSIFINGEALDEPYLAAAPNYTGEWTLSPGQVFVLGDNRNNSNDSKNWGPLDMSEIIGKAVLIYWPMSEAGLIPHYNLIGAAAANE
jgi:signal peptidase I